MCCLQLHHTDCALVLITTVLLANRTACPLSDVFNLLQAVVLFVYPLFFIAPLYCPQVQMERMLEAGALPLLSDISMGIPGLTKCDLFPYPIPDLFCGQPLLVAGKYEGQWPESVQLNGMLPTGEGKAKE